MHQPEFFGYNRMRESFEESCPNMGQEPAQARVLQDSRQGALDR